MGEVYHIIDIYIVIHISIYDFGLLLKILGVGFAW